MKYHFFYQKNIACLRPIKTIAHTRTIGFVFRLLNREYARRRGNITLIERGQHNNLILNMLRSSSFYFTLTTT